MLLTLTTMDTVFGFIDNYYKPLADVAIGSSLEPILMNNFLCHHEKTTLETVKLHILLF